MSVLTLASANILGQHKYLAGLARRQRIDDSRALALRYGLVSAWEFNNSGSLGADVYGGNNLTNNAGVTQVVGPNGANAAAFASGNLQSLSIAASLLSGNIDFWLAGWFNLATQPANVMPLLGQWGTSNQRSNWVKWDNALNRIVFEISPDGLSGSRVSLPANSFGAVSTGIWTFFLCWYDSVSHTANIHINAGTTDSASYSGGAFASSSSFSLGTATAVATFLNGSLAHCAIGKSPPLGIAALASEINAYLYNNGNGRSYPWY